MTIEPMKIFCAQTRYTITMVACIVTIVEPVTQYGGGSTLCKNPIFFTMKEFPQI